MTVTYKARTYRSGPGLWWSIEITDGLPDGMLGVTQARRLDKTRQAAIDVIVDLLEVDPDDVDVEMHYDTPVEVKKAQRILEAAELAAETAVDAAADARRDLVRTALDDGLTMRETGLLLGISHQRVKQLADR
jgi:DNA-directed RNA polymerase specialized sigma24 family protein